MGATEDLSMDDFKASMETNYLGAVRCIKAVLPSMREKRSGCIVNVTSIAGRLAMSPFGAYAASKFALEALSECLAQEVAPLGIRVAIVEPGIIDTAMAERISTDSGDTTQLRHPVGPDAAPFIAWRPAMSDEQWVEWGALDDDVWYSRVEADFGLDARPKP